MSNEKELMKLKNLIKGLSKVLTEIIQENSTDIQKKSNNFSYKVDFKSMFSCKNPPSISIDGYLERIIKYSKLEESTLIISLIYIDRICDYNNLELSLNNIHR